MMINRAQNYCTSSGSEFFKKKHKLSNDAFNLSHQSIYLSSIGFGMYKGEYKGKNQREIYQKIIKKFISSGVNVFDVARKYRNGFSEIDLGIAIRDLIKKKRLIETSFSFHQKQV